MNLLTETINVLKNNGKTPEDVEWCGGVDYGYFSWEEFKSMADYEYDNGFGAPEVVTDLLIVGKDFWLERFEYDGSEEWRFKTAPRKPKNKKIPKKIVSDEFMWETLSDLEGE